MYSIAMQAMSPAFQVCWSAAGNHLNRQVDGGIQAWLRAHPYPPVLEHLSFRLGSQLFFVRIEDVAGRLQGPGTRDGLRLIARETRGHACLMPMQLAAPGVWKTYLPGWGLVDIDSDQPLDPVSLVTDEPVEMSPWEIQDMAVQVVRDHLEGQGRQLMSWQGNPAVDPSIWFVGDSGAPEWVIVRAARFPLQRAARPKNWEAIAEGCAHLSKVGHFASVSLASAEQPFRSADEVPLPMWRGHGIEVDFAGLE